MGSKSQLLRDSAKRVLANQNELQRRAFLYVARNTSLPPSVRHRAQLGLNAFDDGRGRMGLVKNRCVETGRGRGIMSGFGLCRVSFASLAIEIKRADWEYQFRLKALAGELPGVKKASW